MSLIFSVSNLLAKSTKLELARLTDCNGQNPGVQPVVTNSVQVGWQFQLYKAQSGYVVIAIESYSRYVILLPFYFKPSWAEVQTSFFEQWLSEVQRWFSMGGFVRNPTSVEYVATQFQNLIWPHLEADSLEQVLEQPSPLRYRNLDMSINGHIIDTQFWIRDYLIQNNYRYFEADMAQELSEHINNQSKKVKGADGKKRKFMPFERFIDDSLYRFAQGLCDQAIPGCAMGDFPNPHKRTPILKVV